MQADRHTPPGHQSIIVALLIIALSACTAATQAEPADGIDALEQQITQLHAEVLDLRQTVALLNGGAAVVPGHGQASATGTFQVQQVKLLFDACVTARCMSPGLLARPREPQRPSFAAE